VSDAQNSGGTAEAAASTTATGGAEQVPCACPACGNGFRLPAAANGRATSCPFCKKRFRIRPNLGELIAATGPVVVAACGACERRVWVGASAPLLDRACPLCLAGRLTPVAGEHGNLLDPPSAQADAAASALWTDVPLSFAGAAHAAGDAPAASLAPGARLAGRYVVRRLLRVDRVSAWYEGRDELQEKDRTLQVLFPSRVADKKALGGALAVVDQLGASGVQGVLAAHGSAQDGERGLWVTAWDPIRGVPLSSWIEGGRAAGRRATGPALQGLARRIAEVLGRLPGGLAHGFLLPENVLVAVEGGVLEPVLMGFLNPSRLALDGPSCGEAHARFLAPELRARPAATRPGDVYSTAAIAAELLSGAPVPAAPGGPLGLDGATPEAAIAIGRALDAVPEMRPASLADLALALAPPAAPRLPDIVEAPPPPPPPRAATPAPTRAVDEPRARRHDSSSERVEHAKQQAQERARSSRMLSLAVLGVVAVIGIVGALVVLGGGDGSSARMVSLTPADGAVVSASGAVVEGMLSLPAPSRVVVNGVTTSVDKGGRFRAEVVPGATDELVLDVRMFGLDGRSLAVRRLAVDRTPPQVLLDETGDAVVGVPALRVSGRVVEKHLAEVKINGHGAALEAGAFSRLVPLPADVPTRIEVLARDRAGNLGTAVRTVTRDATPPKIELAEALPAVVRGEPRITVRLRIEEKNLARVEADGARRETTRKGEGVHAVAIDWALSPGVNELSVTAADIAGLDAKHTVVVHYEADDVAAKAVAKVAPPPRAPVAPSVTAGVVAVDETPGVYLEVPLVGTFGDEITADGVEEALAFAVRKKIEHVVLVIDSGGGMVAVADEIQRSLEKHDAALTYHCVVKRAISASIWVVFASDVIYFADGATFGGAVVFSRSVETGNAEVNAKMNSIIAADMVARAERKKHAAIFVRPMILKEAEVYAWMGADGALKLAEEKPSGVSNLIVADSKETVLTLTAKQAVGVGLGRALAGPPENISVALARPKWTSDGEFGALAMERGKKTFAAKKVKAQKIVEKFDDAVNTANRYIDAAAGMAPGGFSYATNPDGRLTKESQALWRDRTDACIAAYNKVLRALDDAEREDKNLQKMGYPSQLNRAGVKDLRERVKLAQKVLQSERGRE